jgi:hypothetical protein
MPMAALQRSARGDLVRPADPIAGIGAMAVCHDQHPENDRRSNGGVVYSEAYDGFNIMFPWVGGGLEDFVDRVVPELQRRGSSAANTRARPCAKTSACRGPKPVLLGKVCTLPAVHRL